MITITGVASAADALGGLDAQADDLNLDGGAAFPFFASTSDGTIGTMGMSTRLWLAGQALPGVMARHGTGSVQVDADQIAAMALRIADAVLAAGEV